MAREESLKSISLEAGADLSAKQYLFGVVDSNGKLVVAGAKAKVAGVIQNNNIAGEATTVGFQGVSKVKAGAAITAGAEVESDAAGKAVTLTDGKSVGIALESATADGQIISVLLK